MEWLEKNVRSDLRQRIERENVQGGSETSNVVRVGDGGTDEKTGGGDGVLQLRTAFSRLTTLQPCVCGFQYQQVRHKKGTGRYKAPSVGKDKDKWVPRLRKLQQRAKVMPKNWDQFLARTPQDDVWIRTYYAKPTFPFEECIAMHREFAAPEMSNNLNGLVHMEAVLNLTTKKKTKFMGTITGTISLPHFFDDGTENRIVAFCKTPEDKKIAEDMGATFVGGLELVKALEKGEIHHEDYNHVLCTMDMLIDVVTIRKHLKDFFPNKAKGTLGDDMTEMMNHFVRGKTYLSTKDSDAVGKVEVNIGTLDMSTEQLVDNFNAYISMISDHRLRSLGPFVTEAYLTCPPSTEKFKVTPAELVPATEKPSEGSRKKPSVTEEDEEDEQEAVAN